VLKTLPGFSEFQLTPQNWMVFEEIVRILSPLEKVTKTISGDNNNNYNYNNNNNNNNNEATAEHYV
jgi:hypothetical protein